jgi:hypothetical protein
MWPMEIEKHPRGEELQELQGEGLQELQRSMWHQLQKVDSWGTPPQLRLWIGEPGESAPAGAAPRGTKPEPW